MKRFLAIGALILLLALSCSTAALASTEITIWHQLNYAERIVLAELLEQYEQDNPGITVTAIYRETEELRSGFQNSALAGTGPELVHGPSDQIGPFATMGIIRPLEQYLPDSLLAGLDPKAVIWYEDHLYQVADRFGNHLALVYNKEFINEPPRTMEQLIELGRANTIDANGDGKMERFGLVWNYTEPYYYIPFLGGFGGWMMDEESRTPTLDSEANLRGLRFIQAIRDEHRIVPKHADYEISRTLFMNGQAAMTIDGDWSWGSYLDSGIDLGVARIPFVVDPKATGERVSEIVVEGETLRGRWPTPVVSPRGYSINVHIDEGKLEPTLALLRFLLGEQAQRGIAEQAGIMPSLLELRDDPLITDNPIMRGSLRQIEVGRAMPIVPEMRAIWDAMRPHYQAVLGGNSTPEQATRDMQAEAETKIREMNEVTEPAPYVPAIYTVAMLAVLALLWLTRNAWGELLDDLRKRPFVYWMVLPAFVLIFLTVVYPFFYNVVLSLSNMGLRNFSGWQVIGFQNYVTVFSEPDFWSVFLKTIIWAGVNLIFHVGLGVALALLLNRVLPGKGIIRMLLILPWAVPQYITALTWRGMFNQEYGAINLIISRYLSMPMVNWLGSPVEAFTACILTNIWLGFPFMMIVALGGLQSIPSQLYEAADIDGASWWVKLRTITLPLLRPVLAPAVILGTIWTFNNLNVIWLVSNAGEPSDSTHILVSFVYKSAFNLYRYGYAAAMSMVIFAILLVFGITYMKRTRAVEAAY